MGLRPLRFPLPVPCGTGSADAGNKRIFRRIKNLREALFILAIWHYAGHAVADKLRGDFDQVFQRKFFAVGHPLTVEQRGVGAVIGKDEVFCVFVHLEDSSVGFPSVFHYFFIDFFPDRLIAAAAQKSFVEERHVCGVFKE